MADLGCVNLPDESIWEVVSCRAEPRARRAPDPQLACWRVAGPLPPRG